MSDISYSKFLIKSKYNPKKAKTALQKKRSCDAAEKKGSKSNEKRKFCFYFLLQHKLLGLAIADAVKLSEKVGEKSV